MLYAALGDSITHGYAATTDEHSYVSQVRSALAKSQPVSLFLNAKPGWTSKQLQKSLSTTPECIWEEAKLITLLVGGNDMLRAAPWLLESNPGQMMKVADRLYENLTSILYTIRRPQSTIVIATLYNPFPNSLMCEEYTDILNKSIRLLASREKLCLADVRKQFRHREDRFIEGYRRGSIRDLRLRGNPVHPNDAGHSLIARTLLAAYRQSVMSGRSVRRRPRRRAGTQSRSER